MTSQWQRVAARSDCQMSRRPLARCVSPALRIGWLMLTLAPALAAATRQDAPASTPASPLVYIADVDSIIHPVSAEYMIETMALADLSGATLVVFVLRT